MSHFPEASPLEYEIDLEIDDIDELDELDNEMQLASLFCNAQNLSDILIYLRLSQQEILADRLQEIEAPEEDGDEPLSIESTKNLLRFLATFVPRSSPLVGVTPSGNAELTLITGKDRLTVRFLSQGRVILSCIGPDQAASATSDIDTLLDGRLAWLRLDYW